MRFIIRKFTKKKWERTATAAAAIAVLTPELMNTGSWKLWEIISPDRDADDDGDEYQPPPGRSERRKG